jgi:hypothetical protein
VIIVLVLILAVLCFWFMEWAERPRKQAEAAEAREQRRKEAESAALDYQIERDAQREKQRLADAIKRAEERRQWKEEKTLRDEKYRLAIAAASTTRRVGDWPNAPTEKESLERELKLLQAVDNLSS